jgi:predicted kinase
VRAKTSATAARVQPDAARTGEQQQAARAYLALAGRVLHPPPPVLIAIGGWSGSGKSTLAAALAPAIGGPPGAVVLRSDETRKRLSGVAPCERLGASGYTAEMSARVYAALAEQARAVLAAGSSVIVDAVHGDAADRLAIERAAAVARVPSVGLWLEAPEATLVERVQRRGPDVSDADAGVVRLQRSRDPGAIAWLRIDATAPSVAVLQRALEYVRIREAPLHT